MSASDQLCLEEDLDGMKGGSHGISDADDSVQGTSAPHQLKAVYGYPESDIEDLDGIGMNGDSRGIPGTDDSVEGNQAPEQLRAMSDIEDLLGIDMDNGGLDDVPDAEACFEEPRCLDALNFGIAERQAADPDNLDTVDGKKTVDCCDKTPEQDETVKCDLDVVHDSEADDAASQNLDDNQHFNTEPAERVEAKDIGEGAPELQTSSKVEKCRDDGGQKDSLPSNSGEPASHEIIEAASSAGTSGSNSNGNWQGRMTMEFDKLAEKDRTQLSASVSPHSQPVQNSLKERRRIGGSESMPSWRGKEFVPRSFVPLVGHARQTQNATGGEAGIWNGRAGALNAGGQEASRFGNGASLLGDPSSSTHVAGNVGHSASYFEEFDGSEATFSGWNRYGAQNSSLGQRGSRTPLICQNLAGRSAIGQYIPDSDQFGSDWSNHGHNATISVTLGRNLVGNKSKMGKYFLQFGTSRSGSDTYVSVFLFPGPVSLVFAFLTSRFSVL